MRNAGLGEMLSAHLVKPIENVMYLVRNPWHGEVLAHYKHQYTFPNGKQGVMMESSEGYLMPCENKWLCAVLKKEGTPVKPKSAHVKGSKPWLAKFEYVDYDPKLIAPGVKVKCRDKKVRVVRSVTQEFDDRFVVYFAGEYISGVDLESGIANFVCRDPYSSDIMKILVEKQQATTNLWQFWQGASSTPPVDANTIVQVWCRGNTPEQAERCMQLPAGFWRWKWDNANSDIIAFRIVVDK